MEEYHDPELSDPGLLISRTKPSQSFYWRGVRTIMGRGDVDPEISRLGAITYEINKGRGLIGCVCGMAWRPRDSTFELLSYRPRERWGTKIRRVRISVDVQLLGGEVPQGRDGPLDPVSRDVRPPWR